MGNILSEGESFISLHIFSVLVASIINNDVINQKSTACGTFSSSWHDDAPCDITKGHFPGLLVSRVAF